MYSWLSKDVAMFTHFNYPETFAKRNDKSIEFD